jgi:predicted esterase
MDRLLLLSAALLLFSVPVVSHPSASAAPPSSLPRGVLVSTVACAAQPGQTYALYLPSAYSREKRWPVVYAFDPAARGRVPVDLMKDAAERYGYILVGSNNSRNGPWKIASEAAQAIFQDSHTRLAVDNSRIYFAGFSGGARVAAALAQRCHCAAGVLLNGAGFSPGSPPSPETSFAVFAAVGTYDFNYGEVVELDEKLAALHYPHQLRRFDGPHQWAPATVLDNALAWFRLLAMKDGKEPRDESFISAQAALAANRARSFEQSGDLYSAWFEFRQSAESFDRLTDTSSLLARAAALENQKVVRDGAKNEKQEFDEQGRLVRDISAGLTQLTELTPDLATTQTELDQQLDQLISGLRRRTDHEKRPEKIRVLRRALASVFAQAMEAGQEQLDAKNLALAKDYFELAGKADPDSVWALSNLAVARALDGDRKGALEVLRRAREKTKDPVAFISWLREEAAFAKIRDTSEFQALFAVAAPATPSQH